MSRPWTAFDLDDTLHDFRSASGAAIETVFNEIAELAPVDMDSLRRQHRELIKADTREAFADGLTSTQYRKRRFSCLVERVIGAPSDDFLEKLLDVYRRELESNLRLCQGARNLLKSLQQRGHAIAIITEGPEDAQIWTINRLGISPFVNLLVTSNKYRQAKTTGLFETARQLMNDAEDNSIHYFGDSPERDMAPAAAAGFEPVLVSEDVKPEIRASFSERGYRIIDDLTCAMALIEGN